MRYLLNLDMYRRVDGADPLADEMNGGMRWTLDSLSVAVEQATVAVFNVFSSYPVAFRRKNSSHYQSSDYAIPKDQS